MTFIILRTVSVKLWFCQITPTVFIAMFTLPKVYSFKLNKNEVSTMFKKWDVIVIVILICLSFVPEIVFGIMKLNNYKGTYAEITVNGKFYKKVPLSEHTGEDKINVKTSYGYNIVDIKDQSVSIIDADCKDGICIKEGSISKPGQSLICLPHKLMVEIKSYDNKSRDEIIPAN